MVDLGNDLLKFFLGGVKIGFKKMVEIENFSVIVDKFFICGIFL